MLRERTDQAWFSRLLQHLARKRSRSILPTSEPTWNESHKDANDNDLINTVVAKLQITEQAAVWKHN